MLDIDLAPGLSPRRLARSVLRGCGVNSLRWRKLRESAPIRFFIEMQRADLQYWHKHRSWIARAAYLANSWLHHLFRIAGYSVVYVVSTSKRGEAAFKVRRSFASIVWLSGVRHAH